MLSQRIGNNRSINHNQSKNSESSLIHSKVNALTIHHEDMLKNWTSNSNAIKQFGRFKNLSKLITNNDSKLYSARNEVSQEELSPTVILKNERIEAVLKPLKPAYKHPDAEIKELKEELSLCAQELAQYKLINTKLFDKIDQLENINDRNELNLYMNNVSNKQALIGNSSSTEFTSNLHANAINCQNFFKNLYCATNLRKILVGSISPRVKQDLVSQLK